MKRITRPALSMIAAVTFCTVVGVAGTALACGGYGQPSQEDQAVNVVASHLDAVRRGDAKQLDALWHDRAKVTAVTAKGKRVSRIGKAIKRWTKRPDAKMTYSIASTDVRDGVATVKLSLTWHGQKYEETLTLKRRGKQRFAGYELVAKRYEMVGPARTASRRSNGGY